jgi:hypothetical protein
MGSGSQSWNGWNRHLRNGAEQGKSHLVEAARQATLIRGRRMQRCRPSDGPATRPVHPGRRTVVGYHLVWESTVFKEDNAQ